MCLKVKLSRPRMGRCARPRSDVSTHRAGINSPLQRLIGKREHQRTTCNRNTRRQVTGVARDGQRGDHGRASIGGDKRAVRARGGLIGSTDRNHADIRVHAGRP